MILLRYSSEFDSPHDAKWWAQRQLHLVRKEGGRLFIERRSYAGQQYKYYIWRSLVPSDHNLTWTEQGGGLVSLLALLSRGKSLGVANYDDLKDRLREVA